MLYINKNATKLFYRRTAEKETKEIFDKKFHLYLIKKGFSDIVIYFTTSLYHRIYFSQNMICSTLSATFQIKEIHIYVHFIYCRM